MSKILALTNTYLKHLREIDIEDERSLVVQHGASEWRAEILIEIKEQVGRRSGVYIYLLPNTRRVLYVGKAKSLFTRLKCHFDESVFVPKGDVVGMQGDKDKGLYPAFFRDEHKGAVKVVWIEIEEETDRRVVEEILHYNFKPEFLEFKRKFNESSGMSRRQPQNRPPGSK